ncbi:Malate-2H(+)/Na(+)-lactate antiporter [Rubripirellula lacrimiformis]|uniref:Malate-2H(+)/Na(+)-lactate antiporter n=1 Tax=Rubripirellula lacrimiformis TaxID=1930273 RepID=A0A517N6V2_9BACT|nr:Na+/H+ antiporter NhaC family protein [Rubripirellula lacrimiformis]QDT02728.1 Malate-2H(+)/Na(+)-lactate antiporter [Rubripirellula lacrimiformis]
MDIAAGPESLLPPLVAISLAIASRRVVLPLAAGVFVGAVLLSRRVADGSWAPIPSLRLADGHVLLSWRPPDGSWWESPVIFIQSMYHSVVSLSHFQVLVFSLLLGAMVGVLEKGGGMRALIQRLSQRVRTRCGAQAMVATSGLAIFFDDYSNTLLVGGTMRTTVDRFGVSREKLAYLVDSTAAPVAGLSVVSTWAAIEISYMADGLTAAGIEGNSAAFEMFIQSIPYRFYPWLALVMVYLVSLTGRDLGPMKRFESDAAQSIGHACSAKSDVLSADTKSDGWLWMAAVVPVIACVIAVGIVLVMTGVRALGPDAMGTDDGWLRLAGQVLGNGDSYVALMVGGGVGLVMAVVMHLGMGGCDASTAGWAALAGAAQMLPAMLILWFAWALSAMTEPDNLDTGGYLASVLSDRLDPRFLPTVVFLLAGAIAFSTGTSWGTMAILTPLSIALALKLDPAAGQHGAVALSTCGAVLAGAIFGDHCSPISDTTVLSSRASGCDHLSHVRTQMPYAIVVGLVCIVTGTLPSALGVSPWICLTAGSIILTAIVFRFGRIPEVDCGE